MIERIYSIYNYTNFSNRIDVVVSIDKNEQKTIVHIR